MNVAPTPRPHPPIICMNWGVYFFMNVYIYIYLCMYIDIEKALIVLNALKRWFSLDTTDDSQHFLR